MFEARAEFREIIQKIAAEEPTENKWRQYQNLPLPLKRLAQHEKAGPLNATNSQTLRDVLNDLRYTTISLGKDPADYWIRVVDDSTRPYVEIVLVKFVEQTGIGNEQELVHEFSFTKRVYEGWTLLEKLDCTEPLEIIGEIVKAEKRLMDSGSRQIFGPPEIASTRYQLLIAGLLQWAQDNSAPALPPYWLHGGGEPA